MPKPTEPKKDEPKKELSVRADGPRIPNVSLPLTDTARTPVLGGTSGKY
jgi:hypothetical protein